MKKRIVNLAIVVLLLAGVIACEKNDEYAHIDFSNIEHLCEQPIPVIERAIRGRWKKVYRPEVLEWLEKLPDDHFVEFTADRKYIRIFPDQTEVVNYTWKRIASGDGDSLHIMYFGSVFSLVMEEVRNDTLAFHDFRGFLINRQQFIKVE
jgi:hypothetical protein